MIIADTSGLLAALDPDEVHHEACRKVVERSATPLILSPFVLSELGYLLLRKRGVDAELRLLEDVAFGAYQLAEFGPADVALAHRVAAQYRSLGIGLADASVVTLAQRHGTNDILTLDERHFRAMAPETGSAFRLLPTDLD